MKKKRGRPNLGRGKGLGALLQMRVSPAEKTAFADAAVLAGQSVSVWARAVLRQAARAALEGCGQPVAFLPLQKPGGPA